VADAGLILACAACCCGHPDKGGARIARAAPGVAPPLALAARSFSWTGGGLGPEPV
jgi:hypothetical protein